MLLQLLILPSLLFAGDFGIPSHYVGKYNYTDEILTITHSSMTLSKGGAVEMSCNQSYGPDSLYRAAKSGAAGLYAVPSTDISIDGKKTEPFDAIFAPEDIGAGDSDYPADGRNPGCYEAQGGHACLTWSKRFFQLYCFKPNGRPTVVSDHLSRTNGSYFAIEVDLQADHKLSRINVVKDSNFDLTTIKDDSAYYNGTPYVAFWSGSLPFLPFKRTE